MSKLAWVREYGKPNRTEVSVVRSKSRIENKESLYQNRNHYMRIKVTIRELEYILLYEKKEITI